MSRTTRKIEQTRAVTVAALTLLAAPALCQPCTVTLRADGNTAAVQRALGRPGRRRPVVCLRSGIYKGARLMATRDAVLRKVGRGKVVLDAGARGRVFTVLDKGISVVLQGLTLTAGSAEEGGALAVLADSKVRLVDCWLTENRSSGRGGAAQLGAGLTLMVRTRITRNESALAGAVYVGPGARLVLAHSLIAENRNQGGKNAPIVLAPGAGTEILHSTIAYNHAHGVFVSPMVDGKRAMLRVDSSIIMGGTHAIWVDHREAPAVEVFRSVLHGQIGCIPLDLASSRRLPVFNLTDAERYRPTVGSPAIALGHCGRRFGRLDLAGKKRPRVCTAGALEAPAATITKTLTERARIRKIHKQELKIDEAFNW